MSQVTDPKLLADLNASIPEDEEVKPPVPPKDILPEGLPPSDVPPTAPAAKRVPIVDDRLKPEGMVTDPTLLADLNSTLPKAAPMGAAPSVPAPSGGTKDWHDYIGRYAQIESGGNPNAVTGSYRGVFQMGPAEEAKYGGRGWNEGVRLLQDNANALERKLGRTPTPTEVYLAHQQGLGGAMAHLSNPDAPAWANMYSTGEGQQKGAYWAKRAIWGNVPDDLKPQYGLTPGRNGFLQDVSSGALDHFTSGQFTDVWQKKVEGGVGMRPSVRYAGGASAPAGYPGGGGIDPNWVASAQGPIPEGATQVTDPDLLKSLNTPIDERLQRAPNADEVPNYPVKEPMPEAPDRPPTAWESLQRGWYGGKGLIGSTAESFGEWGNASPTIAGWGTDVREQAKRDEAYYPAAMRASQIGAGGDMVGDTVRWAKENVLEMAPGIAAAIGAPLAAGMAAGPVAATAAAVAPAAVFGFGGMQSALKEADPNAKATTFTMGAGAALTVLNTALPARAATVISQGLTARFGEQAAAEIAQKAVANMAAKGFGRTTAETALAGGTLNALQDAITEVAVSGALDRPMDWGSLPGHMAETFATGALGGGVLGAGMHLVVGRPHVPHTEEPPPPPPGGEVPPPSPPPPPAPPAPGETMPLPPSGAPPPAGGEIIPPGEPLPPAGGTHVPPTPAGPSIEPLPGGYPATNVPIGTWENPPGSNVVFFKGTYAKRIGETKETPSVVTANSETLPGFMTMREETKSVLPSGGTSAEMLKAFEKASDPTRMELEQLGIPDWIKKQTGRVTKDDVLAQVEASALRLESTPTGAPAAGAPIVQHRIDAAQIEGGLSPPPDGHTRLWRGSREGETGATTFTSDLPGIALPFRKAYGGRLSYVDVPTAALAKYENKVGTARGVEFNLPPEIAASAKHVDVPAAGTGPGTLPGGENTRDHVLLAPKVGEAPRVPVATATTTDRVMTDGKGTLHIEKLIPRVESTGDSKTPTAELMLRRMIYQAAAEGKDRVSWTPGQMKVGHARAAGEETSGIKAFYDKELQRAANKIAAKLPDARTGRSFIDLPGELPSDRAVRKGRDVPYFEMTERTRDAILGKGVEGETGKPIPLGALTAAKPVSKNMWRLGKTLDARPQLQEAGETVWRIARKLGITHPIQIVYRPRFQKSTNMAFVYGLDKNGKPTYSSILNDFSKPHSYVIELSLEHHQTLPEVWATLTHEMGHIVQSVFYTHGASPLLKIQLDEAYQRTLKERAEKGISTHGGLIWQRDNFLSNWLDSSGARPPGEHPFGESGTPLSSMTQERKNYWLGFDEWFAEQVARHFTTSEPALNAVDRFFTKIGNALREMYQAFKAKYNTLAEPDAWIKGWLDSRLTEFPDLAMASEANKQKLADANANAMKATGTPDYPSTPMDATSIPGRKLIAKVGETPAAMSMAAAADRFNGFYKWMLSVVQVAARNLHIQPLQRYVELWQQKQLERARMMTAAVDTLRVWRNLGRTHADNVSTMLDEYMNMAYLTPEEVKKGVVRRPTSAELDVMQKRLGMNDAGRKVFERVIGDFDTTLVQYEALLRSEAMKIADPAAQAKRLMEISQHIQRMKNSPYAPAMRFGDLVLRVKDKDGNVVSRYHFETEGQRKRAEKDLQTKLNPGEYIEKTAIPEQAKPFMGLPPGLLDMIAEKLNLSQAQRDAISELKYEYMPAHGFQHRFQRKSKTPGYSMDFMRAYAQYFFHGSNYFTNVKYVGPLRDEIGLVKLSAEGLTDSTKRIQIHNFMNDHLNYMLDPKPDFAHLRGAMFHWALGFSPTAALVNLSQMAVGSYPFLAGKFGDIHAIPALLGAGRKLSTYYKRSTLAAMTSERDMRALSEGVKQGTITEAMAPELAGLSEQDNLRKGAFGKGAEAIRLAAEASSFMFQTTEQVNRRVTFRAAWQLALDHPAAKYVKEMILKHSLQYESLLKQGWAENEAAAFVTAKDAVESTQFIYSSWATPAFMQGKWKTAFIFKNFMQNTMFMLWHYPEARVRAALTFAMLGGLMGLPGASDIESIVKAVGWRLFGKDWDPEQEARNLVINLTEGKINPDILLHGASRYGFGMQAVLGMMGVPFPTVDMSRSIGMGRLLPVDPNTLLGQGATKDPKGAAIDTMTQLLGYAAQVNANVYNASLDSQLSWDDAQRWTKAMPRALAGLSRSYQALRGDDPAIRTRTGTAVIRFDTSDAPQMMEALSMAAGFEPLRLTRKWDVIMAQREAEQFWNLKREALLRQAGQAKGIGDQENFQRTITAIRDFNANLPPEARGKAITADNIYSSLTTKATTTAKMEAGLPSSDVDIPIVRDIQRLYPGAEINVRRTK